MLANTILVLKRAALGLPLATRRAAEERLTKRVALAVFSSNALSSIAYATEEILLVLVLAGTAATAWSPALSLTIVMLVAILTASYCQIILAYPEGGGAYVVASGNLGIWPGLVAAAALLVDYVLTVAVSIAAGVAALTSAAPWLSSHREAVALLAITLMVMLNLRGAKISGRVLAPPTHVAIVLLLLLIVVGVAQALTGHPSGPAPQAPASAPAWAEGVTLFLLLRAFAAGCTAVTGMEVISNGVRAFRPPEQRNAVLTMVMMAVLLAVLFFGISALAYHFGIVPRKQETVVSQLARAIVGEGPLYYLVQGATMLLLILAANSSFVGFPHLASILGRDGYMPHQMASVGDRLVFSNGIIILGVLAGLLIVIFQGDTHALIPLYAVGVFLSFTLAQTGMARRWWVRRGPNWRSKYVVNGVGAIATGLATAVIAGTKFLHGAWIVLALIPGLIVWFRVVHRHYAAVHDQLSLRRDHRPAVPVAHTVLLPVSGVNRAILRALDYARQRGGEVHAVLVDVDREETSRIETEWAQWGCGVNLVVLPSPYRSVVGSLMSYIEDILEKHPEGWVTVVLAEVLPARWWQHVLHNQRALLLKAALLFHRRVVVIDVPFHLER